MIHVHRMLALGMCLVVAACAGCATESARNVDPQADQVLKSMSEALGRAEAISFKVEGMMDEVLETGQLAQFSRRSKVLLARPDSLHADTTGDDLSRSVWYDGRTVTVLDNLAKTYASVEVPNTIEKMLDLAIDKYGLTMPAADLLFGNSYKTLIANVTTGTYIGLHSVGDHPCHHLAFRQEEIDWQIWVDAGETPVPRKLLITYKQETGHPTYSITMGDWDLSAKAPADRFAPNLPADAKRVEMEVLLGLPPADD